MSGSAKARPPQDAGLLAAGAAIWARLASHRTMNIAFVDQVTVSGCNFLGGVLLARTFGLYEFGRFTLAWMLVEFVGSLQFAAIIQPMLNIGPKQAEPDGERYYHAVAAQQAVICIVSGMLVWVVVSTAGRFLDAADVRHLAMPLCAATMFYQLHNFFRRYFFARDRAFAALCNDVLRFAVQLAATLVLPFVWPHAAARAGLWIIAGACALSAIQGATYFGSFQWNADAIRRVARRNWEFSKWLLPSALMFWTTSQAFTVMSGLVLGAAVTGGLKAAVSITGILNILLLALDNFAPVQASRALHVGGQGELRRYIGRLAGLTGLLIVVTVAVLAIDPDLVVHLLFGDRYKGIGYLVRWLCAPASIYGLGTILVIWAAAMEWTRLIFISYAVATIFTLVAAYPLTSYGGVAGVVLGSLMVETIRVGVLLVPLLRSSSKMKPDPSGVGEMQGAADN